MKPKIVFFDCDGVLISGNAWYRLHRTMGITDSLDKEWAAEYSSGKLTHAQWTQNVVNHYKNNKLTRKIFEDILDAKNFLFNKEAGKLIDSIKAQGIDVAIISSGIDYYVKEVAEHFGIEKWRCNAFFDFDEKGNFTNIRFITDDHLAKNIEIKDICKKLNINPEETFYIGDSANDIRAFEFTKHGILYLTDFEDPWRKVNSDLIKSAWKKVNNLEEVIDIIKTNKKEEN
ncbi:MAG: hypothetical protein A3B38_02985 [Candidatus Levybacteria bacterium RIFCSPLOWO2_01_FULL_36_13]|nr:MAG: hypothetical protein A2684_04075 [Candidatus Levybacteria bacterium RIFCSPHIGHO2_01_FULL_36_15b]OGH35856.1 MAG: hypothetical protein A3B38_02985 [Candidatus Levybacteria bacterium RIFCSPLOWO2_01_FULL_36_13]